MKLTTSLITRGSWWRIMMIMLFGLCLERLTLPLKTPRKVTTKALIVISCFLWKITRRRKLFVLKILMSLWHLLETRSWKEDWSLLIKNNLFSSSSSRASKEGTKFSFEMKSLLCWFSEKFGGGCYFTRLHSPVKEKLFSSRIFDVKASKTGWVACSAKSSSFIPLFSLRLSFGVDEVPYYLQLRILSSFCGHELMLQGLHMKMILGRGFASLSCQGFYENFSLLPSLDSLFSYLHRIF